MNKKKKITNDISHTLVEKDSLLLMKLDYLASKLIFIFNFLFFNNN